MTTVRLDDTYRNGIGTRDPAGGGMVAADSTPTWAVYEDASDTAIRTGNFTARAAVTGRYRMSESITEANGYELFKYYEVWAETTVNTIDEDVPIDRFIVLPQRLSLICEVNVVTDNGDFTLTDVDTLTGTNDIHNGQFFVFLTGNNRGIARKITDYVGSTQQVTFEGAAGEADEEFPLTVTSGDFCEIIGLNR